MLAVMMMGCWLSMFIGNRSAPILVAAVLEPVIADFSAECRFARALLLGLAFSCNIGGMMSPISSLQNALCISYMAKAGLLPPRPAQEDVATTAHGSDVPVVLFQRLKQHQPNGTRRTHHQRTATTLVQFFFGMFNHVVADQRSHLNPGGIDKRHLIVCNQDYVLFRCKRLFRPRPSLVLGWFHDATHSVPDF